MPFGKKIEEVKKKGNDNASTDDSINLDDDGQCLGDPTTNKLGGSGCARRPVGHKATKADINRQDSPLEFQDTLRELIVEKEEAIA
jgi:hypothetical protein